MPEQSSIPLGETLRRFFRRTRLLETHEWSLDTSGGPGVFGFRIHAPRTPTCFELRSSVPLEVTELIYGAGDDEMPVDFTTTQSASADGVYFLGCQPVLPREIRRARILVSGNLDEAGGKADVRAVLSSDPDLDLMRDAHEAAGRREWRIAVDLLQEWVERYSPDHVGVCYSLADCSRRLGWRDLAEEYSARAAMNLVDAETVGLYRTIQRENFALQIPELRQLQKEAAGWTVGSQQGAVVLERSRRHLLGLDATELRKSRLVVEVRRAAAARKLAQLRFLVRPDREMVLHTSLQVVHGNDEIEDVPEERFSIRDVDQGNPWRGGTNSQAGSWIPPDLVRGDLLVLDYDLLHRNEDGEDGPRTFSVLPLFDSYFATFRGRTEFVSPESLPVRFAFRNGEAEQERKVRRDGRIVHTFVGERHVPAKRTGFHFESNWLNPLVACATDGPDWEAIAWTSRTRSFGIAPLREELPAPLERILDAAPEERALEMAFYWIRDKLRYASVQSVEARIGAPDRGHQIVEAGVGDCKDKSYLLALVCHSLRVPYEFVFVSAEEGILIGELPANQFDHVLLRARIGGRWLYLDATDEFCTFGSAPVPLQGIQALAAADPASIVEIPVDPPSGNRIRIRECLEAFRKGRVSGQFEVDAEGQIAREGDENWKAISLTTEDPVLAGVEGLSRYLPGALVDDYGRVADTADSGRFRIQGIHSRGPLTELERHQRGVLSLSWDVPTLPLAYWRMLEPARLFVFPLPMTIAIELRIEGDVRRAMDDVSRIGDLDNAIASITEEIVEEAEALEIRRKMVLKKKFVRDEETELIPQTLELFEKALRLVVSCRLNSTGSGTRAARAGSAGRAPPPGPNPATDDSR